MAQLVFGGTGVWKPFANLFFGQPEYLTRNLGIVSRWFAALFSRTSSRCFLRLPHLIGIRSRRVPLTRVLLLAVLIALISQLRIGMDLSKITLPV